MRRRNRSGRGGDRMRNNHTFTTQKGTDVTVCRIIWKWQN